MKTSSSSAARAPATSVANLWQPLGPGTVLNGPATGGLRITGRVNALAVHEAGERVYAATANGGVWYSGNGGASWESLGGLDATDRNGIERSAHRNACGAISVIFGSGADPDVVYVGTGEVTHPYGTSADRYMSAQTGRPFGGIGILRGTRPSAGGPVTWVREAKNLIGNGVYRIALEPGGNGVVAATLKGLYQRPAVAGLDVDWVRVSGEPFDELDVECTDVLWTAADGARPARLWVWVQSGVNAGLWVRATGAADFTRIETPGARGRRGVLRAATPANQLWLFVDQPDDVTRGPTAAAIPSQSTLRMPVLSSGSGGGEDCLDSDDVREGFFRFPSGQIERVGYTVVNGIALFEGDIRLGTAEEVEAFTAQVQEQLERATDDDARRRALRGIAIVGDNFRWPGGIVPWTAAAAVRDKALGAIEHWESRTRIRFVERTPANAAFYPNWVDFQNGDGCNADVGMQGVGAQVISVGDGCDVGRTVHEVGHALGLWHEQSRADREKHVHVVTANIREKKSHNFDFHKADGIILGPYDYGSIMHYERDAFSNGNGDTVVPLGGQEIGQRVALSPGDVNAIRSIYPNLERPLLFRIAAAGAATPVAQPVVNIPDVAKRNGFDSLALAVDPTSINRVVLGGRELEWTTEDGVALSGNAAITLGDVATVSGHLKFGGATGRFFMVGVGVPPGVHDLQYSNGGGRLWAACDGGVFRSDHPVHVVGFYARHHGISASEIVQHAAHPTCEGRVIASARGDGLVERFSSGVWRQIDHAGARGLAFDPLDPRRFVVQRGPGRYASSDGVLIGDELLTRDTSFSGSEQNRSAAYSVPALVAHRRGSPAPSTPNVRQLLVGTHRVWFSADYGSSWLTLPSGSDPLPANATQDDLEEAVTACVWQSPDVAWILGESRVVRLARTPGTDAGGGPGTWTSEVLLRRNVKPKKDPTSAEGPIRQTEVWNDIAVNLDAPPAAGQPAASHGPKGALYLGTSGKPGDAAVDTLWWFNGDSTWFPTGLRSLGTAAPVTAILCDPAFPNEVYAGTTLGVFKGVRTQTGTAAPVWVWTALVNGLPEAPVQSLSLFSDGPVRLLRAGIAARGVWELRLDTTDVPSLTYLRVHADDLRYREVSSTLGRNAATARSWHASPDVRPRVAPFAPARPGSLPWTRSFFDFDSEGLRRFQAALRARTLDDRVRPTGEWDKYFDELLRALGAPTLPGTTQICIDEAFWQLNMVAPHVTAEPWGGVTPTEADLLELTPELGDADANRTSCSIAKRAARVEVVVHQRGSEPVDGANTRVTLLWWRDPRTRNAAIWSDATTWNQSANVPWTAAVNQVLNSPTGDAAPALSNGWAFVGTTNATRRKTLTNQTLDPLHSGVASFDLNLAAERADRVVLLVAIARTNTDIALAPAPLETLTLSNPNVAVRSLRVVR